MVTGIPRRRPVGVRALVPPPDAAPLRVATVDPVGPTTSRLRRLAGPGELEVVAHVEHDGGDALATLPDALDAVVVVVRDLDADGLLTLRRLHRQRPRLRLVVVATSTRWFEEAFEAGADAWIATDADDRTLLTALHGLTRRP